MCITIGSNARQGFDIIRPVSNNGSRPGVELNCEMTTIGRHGLGVHTAVGECV